MRILKISPFIKDVAITEATSFMTILSIIIVTRLLAQGLGVREFGAYSLARLTLSMAMPFTTLAMGVAITRYTAASKEDSRKLGYLLSGFIIVVAQGIILLLVGLTLKVKLAALLFHDRSYASLVTATLLMLIGYSFYSILYAFYRGLGKINKASLWQLGIMAIGPVAIAFVYAGFKRADLVVTSMGMLSFITLLPITYYISKATIENKHVFQIRGHLRELLGYGLPRVPGGLIFTVILAVGPFLTSYFGSLKDAGYLIVGQSLFRVAESGLESFGIVALPRVTQLFIEEKGKYLKERVTDIIALILHVGLFAALHLLIWSDRIILIWLGKQYIEAIPIMRILLLSLVPYLAFVMLRSIIDAIQEKAVNTINLFSSLVITLFSSILFAEMGFGILGLAIGTMVGLTSLGLLTTHYVWKTYQVDGKTVMLKQCLLANMGLATSAFIFKRWAETAFNGTTLVGLIILIEGLLLLIYCAFLWKLKVRWVTELRNRVTVSRINFKKTSADLV